MISFSIGLILNFTSSFKLSEDIYRYLFDGFLVKHNINPYTTAPNKLSSLISKDFPFYNVINNPEVSSPYPPLAIAFSLIFVLLFGYNTLIWLVAMNVATTLVGFFLIKILHLLNLNPNLVILWSLNPNVLLEFNSSGHNDVLTILFLAMTIFLLLKNKNNSKSIIILVGLLFSVSVGLKLFTFILFPFLYKFLKILGSSVVLVSLGIQFLVFFFLINLNASGIIIFLKYWRFNGGLFEFTYFVFNNFSSTTNLPLESTIRSIFLIVFVIIYGFIIVLFFREKNTEKHDLETICKYGGYSFIVLFIFSPVLHPWYLLWAIFPIILASGEKIFSYWVFLFVVNLSYLFYLQPEWSYTLIIFEYSVFYFSLLLNFKYRNSLKIKDSSD